MKTLAVALMFLILPTGLVFAHAFTIALVVPAEQQAEAHAAFMLAARERDAHADETSDGHLGGLDSHLRLVEPGADFPTVEILIMSGNLRPPDLPENVWLVLPDRVSRSSQAAFLGKGEAGFSARFEATFGRTPRRAALRTYIAARLVDIAVRAVGGADDPASLEAAISRFLAGE